MLGYTINPRRGNRGSISSSDFTAFGAPPVQVWVKKKINDSIEKESRSQRRDTTGNPQASEKMFGFSLLYHIHRMDGMRGSHTGVVEALRIPRGAGSERSLSTVSSLSNARSNTSSNRRTGMTSIPSI